MRIGIYDPYLDSLGGGEKYMLSAASCLSDENEVLVFWDDPTILEKATTKLNIDLSKVKTTQNIFSPEIPTIKKLDESIRYDFIFFLSDGSIPFTLAKKTILHFQFPVEWVQGNTFVNKLKFKQIYDVICNSKFTQKYIDKKFGIHSTVIYPPCITSPLDKEKQKEIDLTQKENLILTVGRYNALPQGGSFKKHEILIDVWKKMIDNGTKGWQFVIATSYLPENEKHVHQLEKQIGEYPIKIIRNAPFEEITKLYQKAKIYWHASGYGEDIAKHPERTEHFGITTVEAMYAGAVPVVIGVGGQPEIIDEGETGFLWNTTEELIQKTQKLIEHDKMRNEIAKKSIEKAKQFSTEIFCEKLKEIINE